MSMITAIICDLDGLLADSEKLHMRAYQKILKQFDYNLKDEEYARHWIKDGLTIKEFVKVINLNMNPKDLHDLKKVEYKQLVRDEIQPMPYALEFLEGLPKSYKLAVATSSYRENAIVVLDQLNITKYFNHIITGNDVVKVKPDPEIFYLSARKLNVEISECVVLEDAQKGIDAAHAGGFKSIAVPNVHTNDNDFSKATKVVTDLSEITQQLLTQLG